MKGMQRVKRGKGFRGLLNYSMDHDHARIVGGNMAARSPRALAVEFKSSRSQRQDIEKPVWHNSLRLPAGEHLSDEKWDEITNDYMRELGFSEDHQYVVIKHDNPDGEHVHIIASRISLDAKIFVGENENLRSTKIIAKLEEKHGLTITRQPELDEKSGGLPSTKTKKRKPRQGEVEKALKDGFKPARIEIQNRLDEALTTARSLRELEALLAENSITVSRFEQDGQIKGLSFSLADSRFSGSQLGETYKYQSLIKRMSENDKARTDQEIAISNRNAEENQRTREEAGSLGIAETARIPARNDPDHQQNAIRNQGFAAQKPISAATALTIGDDKMYKNALTKARKNNDFEHDHSAPNIAFQPGPERFRMYSRNGVDSFYDTQARQTAFRHDKNNNIVYPATPNPDTQTLDEMLKTGMIEYGDQLTVQGNPEFCRSIVERADVLGIHLANPESELSRIREEIRLAKTDLSDIENFLSDSVKIDKSAAEKNARALENTRAAERQAADRDSERSQEQERMR